jgi:hypothetical protein
MNNDFDNTTERKPRRGGAVLGEWVFHLALLALVVATLVDAALRLNAPSLA